MRVAPIFRRAWMRNLRGAALVLIPLCSHPATLPGVATPIVTAPDGATPDVATPSVAPPGVDNPGQSAGAPAAGARTEFEDVAQLESLARAVAMREFAPLTDRQRLVVGPIEPRLELAKCGGTVRAFLSSAHHMKDRATIELRCQDAKDWHLYVPVRIVGTSPVAVAVHAIVVGTVLKASDMRVEEHDISDLPLGFMDDPDVAVGLTVARPIPGGAYLTNQQLVAPKAVQRGQLVTLVAAAGGLSIRMAGRALGDGLINQRVKVTNLSSGKVVEGIARSEQVVEIILQ